MPGPMFAIVEAVTSAVPSWPALRPSVSSLTAAAPRGPSSRRRSPALLREHVAHDLQARLDVIAEALAVARRGIRRCERRGDRERGRLLCMPRPAEAVVESVRPLRYRPRELDERHARAEPFEAASVFVELSA